MLVLRQDPEHRIASFIESNVAEQPSYCTLA
jgi:hypothetical protein